ncbi:hypothetical protein HYU96_01810 [Candidatus Daviesbacteria bacterium]|nr:hypothetical protein [Candidatus Daviesbacteria bacterium]
MNKEEEVGVGLDLQGIRQRLERARQLRELMGTIRNPMLAAVFNVPTTEAKSEYYADEESKALLRQKASRIREWVMVNGSLYQVEPEIEPLDRKARSFQDDSFSVGADLQPSRGTFYGDGTTGDLLSLAAFSQPEGIHFDLTLSFEGGYQITIDFSGGIRYESAMIELAEMTDIECKLANHYLDRFIEGHMTN